MNQVLSVEKLSKWYGSYHAVKGISFSLGEGEIVGILGPNGAGKTTTLQMLLGLTLPDSGRITYFGTDFAKHRERCLSKIGFASAYSKLQGKLSVRQSLIIHGGLFEIPSRVVLRRIDEYAELLGIVDCLGETYWHLSSGQQTRAVLAKALLSKPQLLLMDEPTASLDPEIVVKIIDIIRELRNQHGVSILFTSHNMEEVSRLCDRVMFLQNGVIEAIDTPLNLTKQIKDTILTITFAGDQPVVESILKKSGWHATFLDKQSFELRLPESEIVDTIFAAKAAGIAITHLAIAKPHLEDVFLAMAKKQRGL